MISAVFLKNKNFQLHWLSGIISQTANYFSFVAMPWLVLGLTNDNPLKMSTVMAASSLPQAFFILFGGALSDRFSPLKTLFVSRILLVFVMVSLAFFIYFHVIDLWMLYVYAFSMGTLSAISIPANQSLLPSIMDKSNLALANGLVMGSMQIAQILGPVTAGWVIWLIKSARGVPDTQVDTTAIAFAFAVDAIGLSIAIFLMFFMRIKIESIKQESVLGMLKQGLLFCWRDKGIAMVLSYILLISFFLHGVLMTGLPIFTKIHLTLAERAYGNLYAMVGIGTISGIILGVVLKPSTRLLGILVLCCDLLSAVCLLGLSEANNFISAATFLALMGVCAGIVMIAGTTWFQLRTPDYLMGRVISILMFSIIGLVPLSASIAGASMLHYSVTDIMKVSGVIIILLTTVGLLVPRIRYMGEFHPQSVS